MGECAAMKGSRKTIFLPGLVGMSTIGLEGTDAAAWATQTAATSPGAAWRGEWAWLGFFWCSARAALFLRARQKLSVAAVADRAGRCRLAVLDRWRWRAAINRLDRGPRC